MHFFMSDDEHLISANVRNVLVIVKAELLHIDTKNKLKYRDICTVPYVFGRQ